MARQSFWILLATILFALMAVFVKAAAAHYSVWEIIFYRSLFGVAACAWVLRAKGISPKTTRPLRHFVRCAVGTTCITLGVWIITAMPLATAQTFTYSSPLWLCLLLSVQALVRGERLDLPMLAAVAAGFLGVLVILRPEASADVTAFAVLMGVLTGATGGGADWMIRSLTSRGEPPERIVFWFTVAGTTAGGLASLISGLSPHSAAGAALLLAVGVTSTAAQISLTTGWAGGHPILNAVYQFSGIPCAVIFGFALFGERLDAVTLLGIAVVAGAGLAATLFRMRAERKKRAAQNV